MITIPSVIKTKSTGDEGVTLKEISQRFKVHTANIAACNIYFQTIRMLNNSHHNVDRDTFQQYFRDALSDIELVTPPTDAFIPDPEEKDRMFRVNRLAAEYIKITERLPLHLFEETFGITNALVILIKHDPKELEKTYDDIFTYYNLFKYIDTIEMLRLNMFSNFTPMIEWIVENVTLKDWQNYLVKSKPDPEKYAAKCEDILFNPDVAATFKFYAENDDPDIPQFDVCNLMMRIVTNMVVRHDIFLVLGTYLLISFAMADFANKKAEDSICGKYVRDVLSKL
jgi:hypothetical protein